MLQVALVAVVVVEVLAAFLVQVVSALFLFIIRS
jgi:hypothetical protein